MKNFKITVLFLILLYIISMTACYSSEEIDYYSDKNNYISSTGIVDYIKYTDNSLYIGFSELDYKFDDDNFKIVGENFLIVKNNDIEEKLEMGDTVTITTAPEYMGDGYVMPIVSITIDGEVLLEFDEGYENLMNWLKE